MELTKTIPTTKKNVVLTGAEESGSSGPKSELIAVAAPAAVDEYWELIWALSVGKWMWISSSTRKNGICDTFHLHWIYICCFIRDAATRVGVKWSVRSRTSARDSFKVHRWKNWPRTLVFHLKAYCHDVKIKCKSGVCWDRWWDISSSNLPYVYNIIRPRPRLQMLHRKNLGWHSVWPAFFPQRIAFFSAYLLMHTCINEKKKQNWGVKKDKREQIKCLYYMVSLHNWNKLIIAGHICKDGDETLICWKPCNINSLFIHHPAVLIFINKHGQRYCHLQFKPLQNFRNVSILSYSMQQYHSWPHGGSMYHKEVHASAPHVKHNIEDL